MLATEGRLRRRPRADPADHHRLRVRDGRLGTVRQRRPQRRDAPVRAPHGGRPSTDLPRFGGRGRPRRPRCGDRGPARRRGRDRHGRVRRPAAGDRRADRHPAQDRPQPDHHRPAGPRRPLDLPPARPGLRLPLPLGRDAHRRAVLRPDDDAQRIRLTSISATRRWPRSGTATTRPRPASVGWSRCPRVSSGSSTSSRPWRCSSAMSDASCGAISEPD